MTRRARRALITTAVVAGLVVAGTLAAAGPRLHEHDRPDAHSRPAAAPHPSAMPSPVAPDTDNAVAKPNILVVMLDDMRADEMRFAPTASRFVRDRGLDFRNSFSPYPLCCPARASFLSGEYSHNHGVLYHNEPYGFGAFDDSRTLAGQLQDAGYRTAMIGKYLNQYGRQRSKVTGKDSTHYVPAGWTDWMAGLETSWPAGSPYAGNTYDYFGFTQNVNGTVVPHRGEYSSTVIGKETRKLIRRYHRTDDPFFVWVTPVAPHHGSPVEADDPDDVILVNGHRQRFVTPARPDWVKGRFDEQIIRAYGEPATGSAEADVSDKPRHIRRWPETTPVEKRRLRDTERQRAEAIYAWDVEFEKILDTLRRTGEYDDTVIVFTSDNGYFLGEHRQRLGKIKPYEPVLRVPLVVAGPGIPHGVRYAPISTVDLTATILDLAGAEPLTAQDGQSRRPEMYGPDSDWTVPIVTEGLLPGVGFRKAKAGVPEGLTGSGLRTGRYQFTRYANGETELYDLLEDPAQLENRWKDPAYRSVRRELLDLWTQYRACQRDQCRRPLPGDLVSTPAEQAALIDHARQVGATPYEQ